MPNGPQFIFGKFVENNWPPEVTIRGRSLRPNVQFFLTFPWFFGHLALRRLCEWLLPMTNNFRGNSLIKNDFLAIGRVSEWPFSLANYFPGPKIIFWPFGLRERSRVATSHGHHYSELSGFKIFFTNPIVPL
jgi:hypothetical protein